MSPRKEFHFNKDNDFVRTAFFNAVANEGFHFSSVVLDKAALTGPGFESKESLYKYTVNLAVTDILPELENATIVVDRCGGREFRFELVRYIRRMMVTNQGGEVRRIKKVRDHKSHANNLLQLADMVCGAVARCYTRESAGRQRYRNIIKPRELRVRLWPPPPE